MTPESQRIAIAKACGWKNCRCDEGTINMPPKGEPDDDFNRDVVEHRNHKPYCGFPTAPHREVLPDYLNDLNAMHEAETTMFTGYTGAYFANLGMVIGQAIQPWGWHDAYLLGTTTAAQRAEAFLRTLKLWKEE